MKSFSLQFSSTLTALALLAVGSAGFAPEAAAGVAFNTFPISYFPQTNYDFPLLDARNVTAGGSFSTSQGDHDNGVTANRGDELEFQIYYHNSGVQEEQATNVIVRAALPGGTRNSHEVSASIDSDQTVPVMSSDAFRGGNIVINLSGDAQTLEFISGSVRHFPNRGTSGQTVSGGDNLLGSGINLGTIKGCFDFSGFVTFRARVGNQVVNQDRNLSISKRVLNVTRAESTFRDATTASPGERVRFEVRFETTGNASQNNVILRDILPSSRLSFVSGSMRLDGFGVSNESDLFGSGRNFGTLSAGVSRTLTFDADVAGAGTFTGTTTLTNTANVRSDQVGTRQDEADVTVQLVLGVQFSLRKAAFNLTQGVDATTVPANPGDLITYTLFYKNTGQTTIQSAVIEDAIHDILELAEIADQGGATSINSIIRWAPVDVPAGVELSRSFQVRVRQASLFPASSDLLMVNIYGNEVRVPVRRPQVLGQPPRTGAGSWLIVALAGFATFSIWVYRRTRRERARYLSAF